MKLWAQKRKPMPRVANMRAVDGLKRQRTGGVWGRGEVFINMGRREEGERDTLSEHKKRPIERFCESVELVLK